jgi:hypothetical protein
MIAKSHRKTNVMKTLAMLFVVLWIFSSSSVTSISASYSPDAISPTDVVRQDMHNIAYLYANHWWTASPNSQNPA